MKMLPRAVADSRPGYVASGAVSSGLGGLSAVVPAGLCYEGIRGVGLCCSHLTTPHVVKIIFTTFSH